MGQIIILQAAAAAEAQAVWVTAATVVAAQVALILAVVAVVLPITVVGQAPLAVPVARA